MAAKILYVTSFSPDLYEASGKAMVESFLHHRPEGRLLVATEGGLHTTLAGNAVLETYNLEESTFLQGWLRRNADIIPVHLGGQAGPCGCPNGRDPRSRTHRPRCTGQWFNRNASRWFRKIASLDQALRVSGQASAIIWLDADTCIRQPIPAAAALEWFQGTSCFYLKSARRKVLESGIIGFHLERHGRHLLELTIERYRSGIFRQHDRWDDAYQFQVTMQSTPRIPKVDLAQRSSGHADVVPHSPLAPYFHHHKGRHGRVLGIMK